MKPKVFTANSIQELESKITEFLNGNPEIEIKFVSQSESDSSDYGWSITYTILYKTR